MRAENDKQVRERLVARGVEELDDVELLSLVVQPKRGEQAIEVAERVLQQVGDRLGALARMQPSEVRMVGSMGMDSAASVVAAFELGRRAALAEGDQAVHIKDVSDVVSLFRPLVGTLDHEELWVVYLASSGRILERVKVAVGGTTALIADVKLILRRALNIVATGLIVVHNHPSGAASPSREDGELTTRLAEAAKLLDMQLLDHIIIARGGGHYSFRANGFFH